MCPESVCKLSAASQAPTGEAGADRSSLWGNLDPCSELGPKLLGMGARSLRALRHLSCPHPAGQGAWYTAWASRLGLGLDLLSCVTSAFCLYLGMEERTWGRELPLEYLICRLPWEMAGFLWWGAAWESCLLHLPPPSQPELLRASLELR